MDWMFEIAKNGEKTIKLNGVYLYSKYHPKEDAYRFIDSEFDSTKKIYLLFGLGLGYHAERLIELVGIQNVIIYCFDKKEKNFTNIPQKCIVDDLSQLPIDESWQILLPNCWVKALKGHPLEPFIEDIKIKQQTYNNMRSLLDENFTKNIQLEDFECHTPQCKKVAAIVSSGPSLNETIHWLQNIKNKVDVYAVGSALKMVLAHQIQPKAVILSDPQSNVRFQLQGSGYTGDLLYLSTANHEAVKVHEGMRYFLCQNGYSHAEQVADQYSLPLYETGGSVAILAFSVVEKLPYTSIILFGQDLGFVGERTHAEGSTSGRTVNEFQELRTVRSNNGQEIYTVPNLYSYLRWFNQHVPKVSATVYNTSKNGAKIEGTSYIDEQSLYHFVKNL